MMRAVELPSAKLILLGNSGVGKTAMTRRLQNVPPAEALVTQATVGVDFVRIDYATRDTDMPLSLIVLDPPGSTTFAKVLPAFYRGLSGAILVYDVTDRASFDALGARWIAELRQYCADSDVPCLVVGNKCDLVADAPARRKVTWRRAQAWADSIGAFALIETSAVQFTMGNDTSPLDTFLLSVLEARRTALRTQGLPARSGIVLLQRDAPGASAAAGSNGDACASCSLV